MGRYPSDFGYSETYTTHPVCRRRLEPEQSHALLTDEVHDVPGFGRQHDVIWTRVGFAYEGCVSVVPAVSGQQSRRGTGRYSVELDEDVDARAVRRAVALLLLSRVSRSRGDGGESLNP